MPPRKSPLQKLLTQLTSDDYDIWHAAEETLKKPEFSKYETTFVRLLKSSTNSSFTMSISEVALHHATKPSTVHAYLQAIANEPLSGERDNMINCLTDFLE